MGVAGSGKSTLAALLARELGATLIEGDDHHLPQGQNKMRRGMALQDADRDPWRGCPGDLLCRHRVIAIGSDVETDIWGSLSGLPTRRCAAAVHESNVRSRPLAVPRRADPLTSFAEDKESRRKKLILTCEKERHISIFVPSSMTRPEGMLK